MGCVCGCMCVGGCIYGKIGGVYGWVVHLLYIIVCRNACVHTNVLYIYPTTLFTPIYVDGSVISQ